MAQSEQILKLVTDRFEAQSRRLDQQDAVLKEILTEARKTNGRVITLEGGQREIQRRADERDSAARDVASEREGAARERARRKFDWRLAALSCACLLTSGAIGELLHLLLSHHP